MTPPRLHVLTATETPFAVVLRRGPAGVVATLGWDRETGALAVGQWLRGRLYEHRCDLSPDGRLLVVFAARGGSHAWTAVSRAPWLRAILYRPQGSTWCGGGAFDAAGRLWLNGARLEEDAHPELRPAPPDAFPHSTDGFHGTQGGTFAATQERRGWRRLGGEGHAAVLARDLPGGGHVELGFAVGARDRAIVSNRLALVAPGGARAERPDWEWADLWEGRLLVAARGALWELADPWGEPRLLHDLSGLAFEAVAAPYEGVAS